MLVTPACSASVRQACLSAPVRQACLAATVRQVSLRPVSLSQARQGQRRDIPIAIGILAPLARGTGSDASACLVLSSG